ncbi:MAG: class II fructose-bisphosphatase [Bdellovibrionales bacterium]
MDRNLALEFVRITEFAALACARFTGRGDRDAADQAAVDAMRKAFDSVNIDGIVVIGEGERDEAPMLYIGEPVGKRLPEDPKVDIALDPLEGTNLCATGDVGALSVIAIAERGNFLHAPDTYMEKIAVGPKAKGVISLEATVEDNLTSVAKALEKSVEDLTVVILERPRHEDLISRVRKMGARIHLIGDGDVSAGIATCWEETGIDIMMGTGGAPEGVITAAAAKCLDGDFVGRLRFRSDEEKERAIKMGVSEPDKIYTRDELAMGDVMFVATGVTDGPLLRGVKVLPGRRATTHSIVMRSKTGTIRRVEAEHHLEKKLLEF